MGLLGGLGIDWKLILAQVVNFAILVWFLHHFLYKPLLKGMASGELERAETDMEKIRKMREDFVEEQKKARFELKKEKTKVLREAEKMAEELKERIESEAYAEKEKVLKRAAEQKKAQKEAQAEAADRQAREAVAARLVEAFKDRFKSGAVKKALQAAYVEELGSALGRLKPGDLDKKDRDVKLQTAVPLTAAQKAALAGKLEKKLKFKGSAMRVSTSAKLLSGCRLEIAGVVIEKNMLNDILHAAKE